VFAAADEDFALEKASVEIAAGHGEGLDGALGFFVAAMVEAVAFLQGQAGDEFGEGGIIGGLAGEFDPDRRQADGFAGIDVEVDDAVAVFAPARGVDDGLVMAEGFEGLARAVGGLFRMAADHERLVAGRQADMEAHVGEQRPLDADDLQADFVGRAGHATAPRAASRAGMVQCLRMVLVRRPS
jgi:hypothetical protein